MLIGILLGTFTGITPGIHVNTLAAMESSSFWLLFAMGLTHTFLDVVPASFLGVPDEETAVGLLPAHRLVVHGRGREVLHIALWSSFLAVLFALPITPLYIRAASGYNPSYGRLLVIAVAAVIVLSEGRGRWLRALALFLLSGALGLAVLRAATLSEPFYHLFTGLFGVPTLIVALQSGGKIRRQGKEAITNCPVPIVPIVLGTVAGAAASLIPAFTASLAALLASPLARGEREYLAVVYSANTANFLFGIVNYASTGRTRNGVAVALARAGIPSPGLEVMMIGAVLIGTLALLAGAVVGEVVIRGVEKIETAKLNAAILVLLGGISLWLDGLRGLWVMLTASALGFLPLIFGTRRLVLMGVLAVPVLFG